MPLDPDTNLLGDWNSTDSANQPPGGDKRNQGDDQLRGIKGSLKRTFPQFVGSPGGVVNASEDELNKLTGINAAYKLIALPPATGIILYADVAPTGFTIAQVLNEHSLRFTSGLANGGVQGGTQGGSYDFGSVFTDLAEGAVPGVGNHTLTGSESGTTAHTHPSHSHSLLKSWNGGSLARERVDIVSEAGKGIVPTYDQESVNGGDYVQGRVTPASVAADAVEGHAHILDLKLKWAACIMVTVDP